MALLIYPQLRPEKGISDSRETIRRKVLLGEFPQPIRTSARRIAWDSAEVDEYLERLKAQRRPPPRRTC
jgi:predicted DNA-binding transcriptional regulator AlpA